MMHFSQVTWMFAGAAWLVAGYLAWNTRYRAWLVVCVLGAASAGVGVVVSGQEAPKPTPVATKRAPDIKGLKLKATQVDVLALFPEADCEKADDGTTCTVYHVSYGGSESGVVSVVIRDGGAKLIQVGVLDRDKFDYMIAGMVTKFGPPGEPTSPTPLTHSNQVLWSGEGWMLGAERRPEGLNYPTVTLVDSQWATSANVARAAEAAKAL